MHASFLTLVLVLAPAAPLAGSQEGARLELTGRVSSGEPLAAALSPDGTRVFAVEGADLLELARKGDQRGRLEPRHRRELDAIPVAMTVHGTRLFLAGGTHGAFVADIADGLGEPRPFASEPGAVCMDVAADDERVVVLFSSYAGLSLHVLDPESLEQRQHLRWRCSGAYAAALHGRHLYVALRAGGLWRFDLADPQPASNSEPGPSVQDMHARDLDVAGGHLWVAGGLAGLVGVDLDGPWSPTAPVLRASLSEEAGLRHASRVAADGEGADLLVAVGSQRVRAEAPDGAPYGFLGGFGVDLSIGGLDVRDELAVSAPDQVALFALEEGELAHRHAEPIGDSGWRSLDLAGGRLVTQRLAHGLRTARWDGESLAWSPPRLARGHSAMDGVVLPGAQGRVLMGFDSMGARQGIGLLLGSDRPRAWFSKELPGSLGVFFDAAWRSPEATWVVTGGAYRPRLVNGDTLAHRDLKLPASTDGAEGHTYFHSHAFGDYVAITRVACEEGLLVYRKSALEAFGRGDLDQAPNPMAVVPTSRRGAPDLAALWRSEALDMGGGRWLLAVAAGSARDPQQPDLPRPRLLTYLVDPEGVRPLGEALGADGPAQAVALSAFQVRGRRWVLLGSLGGKLDLFDLTDPGAPRLAVHQPLPPDPWDATPRAVLDVEVVHPTPSTPQALIAAGRAGLLRIDLSGLAQSPPRPDLIPDEVHDTPGWAVGVITAPSPLGGLRVILGDQKAGARVYTWRFPKPTPEPPASDR